MPPVLTDLASFLGFLLSALGFLLAGFALGRFVLESYKAAPWQLQIALVLGLFGVLIGLADFASPGTAGAFALGVGGAYLMSAMPPKASTSDTKS